MKKRSEQNPKDLWNVEEMYPSLTEWETAFNQVPSLEKLAEFKGRLNEGAGILKELLDLSCSLEREISKLYTYSHLRHDEDISNPEAKGAYQKSLALYTSLAEAASWIEPEILTLDESIADDPALAEYSFHLKKIFRLKAHTLSEAEEKLIASSGLALQASHRAFSAINDADMKYGVALDKEGKEHEITHASFGVMLRSHDRVLRKNAFQAMHGKYSEFSNTLTELLNGQLQSHVFSSTARNYSSCLEAALYPKNIDTSVYHSLIESVRDNLSTLHKYMGLRKKVLKVDELHLYDVYVPLVQDMDITMDYGDAEEAIIDSVAPLGDLYQSKLREGLKTGRWVDRYENESKRSGAYSSGCYDSMPYILMNYKKLLRDVFTLAHEAGHSMHSLLSKTTQPYHYANYPIFVAEVASTFNEDLLMRKMLSETNDRSTRIFLINQKIEDIRSTLFRQTMFAEFELMIHQMAEAKTPITPDHLREKYKELNIAYFGPETTIDDEISIEWSRIPHFYYNFYVYQYATGISAALSLANKVMNGGAKEQSAYLTFLSGGCSKYPIDLLIDAGVDMRTKQPVTDAIAHFGQLVDELETLLEPSAASV